MLIRIYKRLLKAFGPQAWWPRGGGFEPGEWEVCLGAILTQNTNWKNVEKALGNLRGAGLKSPGDILRAGEGELEGLVRPSGYYKQKARKLRDFAGFVQGFGGFPQFARKVTREGLLGVRGIGPETADSILLYALGRPFFVVDAYTRRVFSRLGLLKEPRADRAGYEEIRGFFEGGLKRDPGLYREYHALIVELGKGFCKTRPLCGGCPLKGECKGVIW